MDTINFYIIVIGTNGFCSANQIRVPVRRMQHYGCSVLPIEWLVMRTGQAPASAPCHSRQPAATPLQRSCAPRFDLSVRPSRPSVIWATTGLQWVVDWTTQVDNCRRLWWSQLAATTVSAEAVAVHCNASSHCLSAPHTPAGRGTDAAHQRALIPRNQQQCVLSKHFIIFITNRGQHLSPMRRTD